MKNFLDRSLSLTNPLIELDKNGECVYVQKSSSARPKLVVMSNCGCPQQSNFDVLKAFFQGLAQAWGFELIGEIFRTNGPVLVQDEPRFTGPTEKYKALLRKAGAEIAQNFALSGETKKKLEEPLMSHEAWQQEHNKAYS
jgi:hypothetical protein